MLTVPRKDVFTVNGSLDSSLKKNTAFIKRLRTALTGSSTATFAQEIRSLSLEKYLSEIISATYEGLCKLKSPADIAAGVEVVSGLHQRFGPEDFTSKLAWFLGRGLTIPDKAQLKALAQDAREREEKERLTRHRVLLKVATEFWLTGLIRNLEDAANPDGGSTRPGKEGARTSEGKGKVNGTIVKGSGEAEPFPLEVLKELLGHDREHANLPLVVLFVKSFAWDALGVSVAGDRPKKDADESGASVPALDGEDGASADEDAATNGHQQDPPITSPEMQQRFRNILERYIEDVKKHVSRDQKSLVSQGRRNAEAYVKSGEKFEDREANYDKQIKAQEKLISSTQYLCEALDIEMPDLKDRDVDKAAASGGIGLIKAGEFLRGQSEGAGIWEDEDERRFYENLIDLKDRVPGVLLEEPKKKQEDEQVGKRKDDETVAGEAEKSADATDDQSTAIANKTVGAQVDSLLARLPELQNKEQIDQAAIDFCFVNSKASRNRLIKAVQEVPNGRSDLLPIYSRLVATVGKHLKDVSAGLVEYLDDEFRSLQRRKSKDFLGQVRTGNIRYLAELTKFGVVPEHVIFHCLKVSLDDFSRMNIEIIGNLLENCGRYLLRNPETSPRMQSFLETLQRKKSATHLAQQERMIIENAVYYVNPPERAAIQQKERTPIELYVQKLIYLDMNKRTYAKVLKSIRKLHWEEAEVVEVLRKIFSKPGRIKYSNINLLAILLSALWRYHQDFVVDTIDTLLENITLGLEQNDFKYNQRRLAEVRYLGELYGYKMVDSQVIFDTLYRIVSFGHPSGTPTPAHSNPLDLPDDFFRVRLVCAILDTCGDCFDRGQAKQKLDFFLAFFQYYFRTKYAPPMDIDFLFQDTFAAIRPKWKTAPDLDEAGKVFAEAVAQNYNKPQEQQREQEPEPEPEQEPDDVESSDGEDNDDLEAPEMQRQSSSDDVEADADQVPSDGIEIDDGEEEHIIVKRQEEERDPEADAEFDRELAKMMAESTNERKTERRPAVFDVALPLRARIAQREESPGPAGDEERQPAAPRSTMAFSLMTKKGNRQLELPTNSSFALAAKKQEENERAERARIKDLVLNYDLGIEDENAGFDRDAPPGRATHQREHRGYRTRKLQLSDVDWT